MGELVITKLRRLEAALAEVADMIADTDSYAAAIARDGLADHPLNESQRLREAIADLESVHADLRFGRARVCVEQAINWLRRTDLK
jgi:hypothetical protein